MEKVLKEYQVVMTDLNVLVEKATEVKNAMEGLTDPKRMREMAGEALEHVFPLVGLSELLLVDINALVKSGD